MLLHMLSQTGLAPFRLFDSCMTLGTYTQYHTPAPTRRKDPPGVGRGVAEERVRSGYEGFGQKGYSCPLLSADSLC
jgi:hypothetical protein